MIDLSRVDDQGLDDLQRALALGPTAVEANSGAMLVLSYEAVERLAHDRRLAGVGLSMFDLQGIDDGPLRDWYGSLMFTTEGEEHARLRRLVSRAFTPRSVEALRADTRQLVDEALAPVRDDGGGDLVAALGRVPIKVMCRLLGVPESDVAVFGDWADALSPIFGFMELDQVATATAAITELLGYVEVLAEARRTAPGEDLITALLDVEGDDERLRFDELVAMVANLIVGGHDTTASQLACTLLTLVREPAAAAELRNDPSVDLLASAVDETIRCQPAVVAMPRSVLDPIEIDGTIVQEGSLVLLCTASANREVAVWTDPERFDVRRFTDPGTPRLLTFGAGPHYCLGAALARLTLEEVVSGFLDLGDRVAPVEDPWTLDWHMVLGRAPLEIRVALG